MMYIRSSIIYILSLISFSCLAEDSTDRLVLRAFLEKHKFKPVVSEPFEITKKYLLGQALFFDPILSGNKDISCATCHLISEGTSDASSHSIGPGGKGLGSDRRGLEGAKKHLRNSLALWNRDDKTVRSLFWDGRVEIIYPNSKKIRTPLEDLLPTNLENLLAVQALFPLASPGEMLGYQNDHQDNELIAENNEEEKYRISSVHKKIMVRLLGEGSSGITSLQSQYRRLFLNAYPDGNIKEFNIGHVGNAIAHFEEVAFATRDAAWDKYISGNEKAISDQAVSGAVVFYIKNNCSVCHNGPVFSDYQYHSLALKSFIEKEGKIQIDLGRYFVTKNRSDKYRFRTPSLRNASLTAPYMHDGSIKSIKDSIKRHYVDCLSEKNTIDCKKYNYSELLISSRRPSDLEVDQLVAFIKTLEDDASIYVDHIIPRSVPSGLPVDSKIFNNIY